MVDLDCSVMEERLDCVWWMFEHVLSFAGCFPPVPSRSAKISFIMKTFNPTSWGLCNWHWKNFFKMDFETKKYHPNKFIGKVKFLGLNWTNKKCWNCHFCSGGALKAVQSFLIFFSRHFNFLSTSFNILCIEGIVDLLCLSLCVWNINNKRQWISFLHAITYRVFLMKLHRSRV